MICRHTAHYHNILDRQCFRRHSANNCWNDGSRQSCKNSNPQMRQRTGGYLANLGDGFAGLQQKSDCALAQGYACWGEAQRTMMAVDELCSKIVFQKLDVLRNCRLRNMEPTRGSRHVSAVRHAEEHFERTQKIYAEIGRHETNRINFRKASHRSWQQEAQNLEPARAASNVLLVLYCWASQHLMQFT